MKHIIGLLLRLVYLFGLRGPSNNFQRRLAGEGKLPRVALLEADSPRAITAYAKAHRYVWRKDATRVGKKIMMPLDWVTHPEVFQAKLEQDPYPGGDGDCDDFHNWVAACLLKIPTVEKVYVVSSGYEAPSSKFMEYLRLVLVFGGAIAVIVGLILWSGWTVLGGVVALALAGLLFWLHLRNVENGGHTTCCYKQYGEWFHVNYQISAIEDPNDIPEIVAKWGIDTSDEPVVTFYVYEEAYPHWKLAACGPSGKVAV